MARLPIQPSDVRGFSQLIFDAIEAVTRIIEGTHLTISRAPAIFGAPEIGQTRGISGLIYRFIRYISGSIGSGVDAALAQFATQQTLLPTSFEREATLAALNGVLGDFLEDTHNPLAVEMGFYAQNKKIRLETGELTSGFPNASGKIMIFLHGLCMNELYWEKLGGTQPATLSARFGFTPVFPRYNTGRHISLNGREFAEQLEQLVINWPVPVEEIVLIGHSMGGLVSRSACFYAEQNHHSWRQRIKRVYCLGSPHHGSHLERGGNWIQSIAGSSPYTFSLSRLGALRSAGITDLRYGYLLDDDWQGVDRFHHVGDRRSPLPLPNEVDCYAVAATLPGAKAAILGDGLVRVESAFGAHEEVAFALDFPLENRLHIDGIHHFELMSRSEVYQFIYDSMHTVDSVSN